MPCIAGHSGNTWILSASGRTVGRAVHFVCTLYLVQDGCLPLSTCQKLSGYFTYCWGLARPAAEKILQESPMLCGPSRVIHFSIRCGCVLSDGGARVHCSLVWGRTGTCTRGWRRSRRAGWTTWRSRPSGGPARPPPSPWTPGGTPCRSCSTSRCRPPSPTNSQSDFYWAFYCIYNFDHQVVSLILY